MKWLVKYLLWILLVNLSMFHITNISSKYVHQPCGFFELCWEAISPKNLPPPPPIHFYSNRYVHCARPHSENIFKIVCVSFWEKWEINLTNLLVTLLQSEVVYNFSEIEHNVMVQFLDYVTDSSVPWFLFA